MGATARATLCLGVGSKQVSAPPGASRNFYRETAGQQYIMSEEVRARPSPCRIVSTFGLGVHLGVEEPATAGLPGALRQVPPALPGGP